MKFKIGFAGVAWNTSMRQEDEFELEEKVPEEPAADKADEAKSAAQLNRAPSAASVASITKGKRPPSTKCYSQNHLTLK